MNLLHRDDLRVIINDNAAEWGQPDWSILDTRRGNLPDFPADIFTDRLRAYLERAAAGAGVTVAHVAVPLLAISSGLVGCSRMVQASTSWREPIALWAVVVGSSGAGKTPGISVTTAALTSIEKDRRSRISELERRHQTKTEAAKAAHKKWMRAVDKATDAGAPPPLMPPEAAKVPPFVAPRLYVSNATIERIAQLIQARPSGLTIIVDELAGLFSNMARYSNGSDREFWLEAWNGKPYRVERVGSNAIDLDHLLVGMIGGLQPDKVNRAFDTDDDGFYARLCFAWPPEADYRPLTNDVDVVEPDLVNALSRLIRLSETGEDDVFVPRSLPLSPEAADAFEAFRKSLHDGKQDLEGRERECWAKGATHVLRLAGTIALLEWAWSGEQAELVEIGAPSLNAAIELWSKYLWPHSRACLRQIAQSRGKAAAARILRWCKRHARDEIGIEDARRDALAQSLDAKQTEEVLDALTKRGWLKKITTQRARGRPTHRWGVNPMLQYDIPDDMR